MKTCNTCRESKPPEGFSKDKKRSDGLRSRCRVCTSAERLERVRAKGPRGPLTYLNAEWADGPAVVDWIERTAGLPSPRPDSLNRRLHSWLHGETQPSVFTLDAFLTQYCNAHLSEVPDHVWAERRVRKLAGTPEQVDGALAEVMANPGVSPAAIARKHGVTPRAMRNRMNRIAEAESETWTMDEHEAA